MLVYQSEAHIVCDHAGAGEDISPLFILVDGSVVNLLEGKAFISSCRCKCTNFSAFLCPTPQRTSCCELNDSALTHQTERQERTSEYLISRHAAEHMSNTLENVQKGIYNVPS